jgi:hypothetical protein
MPIVTRIEPERRIVVARAYGTLTDEEIFAYQREAWSRGDVAGFDELVDVSGVERVALPSADRVRDLAALAADMDRPAAVAKLAIAAPTDLTFGLGRMFQARRELDPRTRKTVGVFRTLPEALEFLGLDRPPQMPEIPRSARGRAGVSRRGFRRGAMIHESAEDVRT